MLRQAEITLRTLCTECSPVGTVVFMGINMGSHGYRHIIEKYGHVLDAET